MDKFSDFISEQKNEQPYRFVIIHNEPENMTDDSKAEAEELADNFIKAGKSLGLEGFKCKIEDSYLSRKGNKLFIHDTDDKEFLLDENSLPQINKMHLHQLSDSTANQNACTKPRD